MKLEFNEIKINNTAVKPLISGHPWVYRRKILSSQKASPWVFIKLDRTYYGIFEPLGPIGVRVFSDKEIPSIERMAEKIEKIFNVRKEICKKDYASNAFRLIHGEIDDFPGLNIDLFNNVLVVQPYLKTWEDILPELLSKFINKHNLFCFVKQPKQRGLGKSGYFIEKELAEDYVIFNETNFKFASFYKTGQKSGFYLDLRELRKYIINEVKPNIKVLDLFASDGALSVIMKKNGAIVDSVEISEPSLERSKINHNLNEIFFDYTRWEIKNVWEKIKETNIGKYDLIILDPPNLATSKDQIENALRAWRQLNTFAIDHINKGGKVISCNCSSRLTKELHSKSIENILKEKKLKANLFFLKNSFDHPISKLVPELNYLDISVLEPQL